MRVKLKYVQEYRDRHGKLRRYLRLPGRKKISLPGEPGTPQFMAAYYTALATPLAPIGKDRNSAESVAHWVSLYLASAVFAMLAPDTRRTRKNMLERFRNDHGKKPAAMLTTAHIEAIIGKYSPVVARNFIKAIRPWMKWCVKQGLRSDNPAIDVERPQHKTDGYATWSEELVAQYRAHYPLGTRARLALELLVNTGAARGDAVRFGPSHVRHGVLSFRRSKTDVEVQIPVLDGLIKALDAMPAIPLRTFLVTDQGMAFTPAGFGNWFRDRCNEAGIPVGYSAHGIRKYAATLRANLGATAHELMAWFGWLSIREAERYTRGAERRHLAIGLGERVNAEQKGREQ